MTIRRTETSQEFIRVTVAATKGGDDFDPTGDDVQMALPIEGQPPTVWIDAVWETEGPPWVAHIPATDDDFPEVEVGTYDVYVKITDDPEVPVILSDRLVVFSEAAQFAGVAELADVLRTDIDPEDTQAIQALTNATAVIRAYTRQHISLVEGDEQELYGTYSRRLWLPQRPVLDVSEVSVLYPYSTVGTDVTGYQWTRRGALTGPWDWCGPDSVVSVTYDHGYETIPEDIRQACLKLAASEYMSNAAVTVGVESETKTIGSFTHSVTYGSDSDTTQLTPLPGDVMALLEDYRVQYSG